MILVLTGTHHQPFDRLVAACEALARSGEEVVVQAGSSAIRPEGCTCFAFVAADALEALASQAEVIVTHAGPASLFLAWERGTRVIVVPRDPAFGEHVDRHQQVFAQSLGDRAVVLLDPAQLPLALKQARDMLEPVRIRRSYAGDAFLAPFSELVNTLVAAPASMTLLDAVTRLFRRKKG